MNNDTPTSLRFDFDALIEAVLKSSEDRPALPRLMLDECCNHPLIRSAVTRACTLGLADSSFPLWNQRRVRQDGSILYFWGGAPRDFPRTDDIGKPEKHASWDDQAVVHTLVANLSICNAVLLSENTRFDSLGLRALLRQLIAPKLNDSVSLVALFRRGKTDYPAYCQRVLSYLRDYSVPGGYTEVML